MFRKLTLADIIKQDIAAAEILAHDHEKAAEHHDALANMYFGRLERLKADLGGPPEMPRSKPDICINSQPLPAVDISLEAFGNALAATRAAFSRKPAP